MEIKWTKEIDAAGPGNYRINSLSPIRKESVCITGSYWTASSDLQCFTAKCDSTGEFEWFKIFEHHNHRSVEGKSIAALQGGAGALQTEKGIYVHTYLTDSSGIERSALMRYDSFGILGWEKIVDGPSDEREVESVMLTDYSDGIYIAGLRKTINGDLRIFIAKYNQSGEKIWITYCDNPALNTPQVEFDVKKPNQIIIGGVSETNNDFFYIRCDSLGRFKNIETLETPQKESILTDIKIDVKGNVFITGISHTEETGNDYLTAVYDESDSLIWAKRFDGPAHMDDIPKAIATMSFDDSFNVYVTGCSKNNKATTDIVTIKYDQGGSQLWIKRFVGKTGESVEPLFFGLGFDYHYQKPITPSSFYIMGHIGSDALILKYNTTGFLSWFTRVGNNGEVTKPTAFSGKYIAVESTFEKEHTAHIVKYGKTEQLGIIRWD